MHIKTTESTALYDRVMQNAVHLPNGQTAFCCSYHGFTTGRASAFPDHGDCAECVLLFFLRLEACTPPDKREELMDSLVRHMTEASRLEERGNFDLHITRHPQVEVTLDPADKDSL